jgi:AcrR family transcriptional regulator
MTNPLRQRLRDTTVTEILSAAEEIFAEQGLYEAKMGDIAHRAGVAVGTLYNHFEDREALLGGLVEGRRQELLATVDDRLEELAAAPFPARLRGLVQAILEHAQAHARFFSILMQGETGRLKGALPIACRGPRKTMEQLHARIAAVVGEGVAASLIRPALKELAPVMLLGMLRAVMMRAAGIQTADLVELVDPMLDFFLHGAAAA